MVTDAEVIRGLRGVYFDTTTASYIDGDVGKLVYRGYDIADLARYSTAEETSYLLLKGKLPTQVELDSFDAQLKDSRSVPKDVIEVIRLVQTMHPMDVLRTAVSALAASDPDVNDNSAEATIRKGTRLTAQTPTIVAAHHRIRQGLDPVPPSTTLSHAENFLYMLFNQEPDPDDAKLMDTDFILHAEHGSNASAFAARVVAGTAADLHGAVTAGIATLKGPLHGGAAEAVMKMATEIGTESQAEEYVRGVLENGGRVMGFGHRVYRVEDPRARHLRDGCQRLGEKKGEPEWFRILSRVAEAMQPYQSRGIYVNVDFWAGAIYQLLGIPEDLFISIFALGRVPGWTLQVVEQFNDNILIRPLLKYVGPMDLAYVPIEKRG